MAPSLDLPQRGPDDDRWDIKLNNALQILSQAVDAAVETAEGAEAEIQNALLGIEGSLTGVQDAADAAAQAQADIDDARTEIADLAQQVAELGAQQGGFLPYSMTVIGDVARPTNDPARVVFWIHTAQPAGMLNDDVWINLPVGT